VHIFSGLGDEEEVLSILNGGDLGRPVVYKISKKGEKKLMVAFQDLAGDGNEEEPVKIAAIDGVITIPSEIGLEAALKQTTAHGLADCHVEETDLAGAPNELAEVFPNPCKEVDLGTPIDPNGALDDPEDE
jgi:hypothetical protein